MLRFCAVRFSDQSRRFPNIFLSCGGLRYRDGVGVIPSQPVAISTQTSLTTAPANAPSIEPALLEELWRQCDADALGLAQSDFAAILIEIGSARDFGQSSGTTATREQQAVFFQGLKLAELVLARACARGSERAWEHFLAIYQQPLTRAAIAIAGNETQGRDLADALYAELYGLRTRDEAAESERRCPLDSYQGRGSLMGWLRTILAQRHVDHHRRTWREQSLDDLSGENTAVLYDPPAPYPQPQGSPAELGLLGRAIEETLTRLPEEDRFLLASYYLDERTLLQIARMLQVHEATVSRKLHRLTDELRKQVLRHLQNSGMNKRAAQEALGADPRDLDLNLKKLLQHSQSEAFPEKAGL